MAGQPGRSPSEEKQPEGESRPPHPPNHMFVGSKKPAMSYVYFAFDVLTRFDEIVIKARGAAISRAVDVAEIVTKRLGRGLFEVKSIRIGTEVVGEGGEARNVSTMEIVVGRKSDARGVAEPSKEETAS